MLGLNPKGAEKLTVSCDNAGISNIRVWHRILEDNEWGGWCINRVLLSKLKTMGGIEKKPVEFNFRKVILYHQCWEDSAGICFLLVRKNDLKFSNRSCRVWSIGPQGVSISLWVQPQEQALMGTHMQPCLPTVMPRVTLLSYKEGCICGKQLLQKQLRTVYMGWHPKTPLSSWSHFWGDVRSLPFSTYDRDLGGMF